MDGTERDEKNHPFIHCKTERNGNGKFFLTPTVYIFIARCYMYVVAKIIEVSNSTV